MRAQLIAKTEFLPAALDDNNNDWFATDADGGQALAEFAG